MSASDCYELGVQIIATGYEQYSAQWLNESLIRLSQMPNSKQDTELKLDILQRMVEIHTKQRMDFKITFGYFLAQFSPKNFQKTMN